MKTPIKLSGINDQIYAGFGLRLASLLLDLLIYVPFGLIILYLNSFSKEMFYYTTIPSLLLAIWYYIYLPKKYGGTPGKLIVGIKIIKLDGNPIGWDEAVFRELVLMLLHIFNIGITIMALNIADNSTYESLTWFGKSKYLSSLLPSYFSAYTWISSIWFWSELIVLLTNPRKRALHDYMAGTVLIKKIYAKKIHETMYPKEE